MQRGYKLYFLLNIARKIFEKDRKNFLSYKKKLNTFGNFSSFFVMPFNNSNVPIDFIIYNSFRNCKGVFNLENFDIKVVNSINNNFRRIFVHNCDLSYTNYNVKCSKCSLEKCKCCNFMVSSSIINFNGKFSLPILSNSNCKSENCVYIIHCIFCNSFYVGETKQTMEKRLDGHLSNIRCFVPYDKEISEVALHFNRKGHNFSQHLKVFIFANNLTIDEQRLDIESEIIHLFLTFECKIINAKILRHIRRFCSSIKYKSRIS